MCSRQSWRAQDFCIWIVSILFSCSSFHVERSSNVGACPCGGKRERAGRGGRAAQAGRARAHRVGDRSGRTLPAGARGEVEARPGEADGKHLAIPWGLPDQVASLVGTLPWELAAFSPGQQGTPRLVHGAQGHTPYLVLTPGNLALECVPAPAGS